MKNTIGRMTLVLVLVTLVVMTALAVPPPFEARLCFVGGANPLDVRQKWDLSNPISCTTESTTGSLWNTPEGQSWVLVPKKDSCVFNMSPGGTGTFDFWVEINMLNRVRFAGTFNYIRQGGTVVCNGTARIVQTSGLAVQGWTMAGSMRAVTQNFVWGDFDASPSVVQFVQDSTQMPGRGQFGFWISGTIVKGGAGGGGGESASLMMTATASQEVIDVGLEVLEEAGPAVTEEQIDAVLMEMEEAVGIRPRRGGR